VSSTSNLGANVTTSSTQTYNGAVTLSGGDRTLTGSTVNFVSTLAGGTNALTVTGNLDLDDAATDLSTLEVSGTSNLGADVTTSGNQTYSGNVVISAGTLASPLDIQSNGGNITFSGTLTAGSGSKAAQRSLRINGDYKAGNNYLNTGSVTFNDSVGYAFKGVSYFRLLNDSFYSLDVTGNAIYLNANVMTFETQEYSGPVIIGNNGSNGTTRTLLSMDPSITFNHTVDDSQADVHTLIVSALALSQDSEEIPTIVFEDEVGQIVPLNALYMNIGVQDTTSVDAVFEDLATNQSVAGQSIRYGGETYNAPVNDTNFATDGASSTDITDYGIDGGEIASEASTDKIRSYIGEMQEVGDSIRTGQPTVEVGEAIIGFPEVTIATDDAADDEEDEEGKVLLCSIEGEEASGADCAEN